VLDLADAERGQEAADLEHQIVLRGLRLGVKQRPGLEAGVRADVEHGGDVLVERHGVIQVRLHQEERVGDLRIFAGRRALVRADHDVRGAQVAAEHHPWVYLWIEDHVVVVAVVVAVRAGLAAGVISRSARGPGLDHVVLAPRGRGAGEPRSLEHVAAVGVADAAAGGADVALDALVAVAGREAWHRFGGRADKDSDRQRDRKEDRLHGVSSGLSAVPRTRLPEEGDQRSLVGA
jgi:hypothetical protein